MKAYVVTKGVYDDHRVIGLFTSEDLANQFIERAIEEYKSEGLDEGSYYDIEVEVHEVDRYVKPDAKWNFDIIYYPETHEFDCRMFFPFPSDDLTEARKVRHNDRCYFVVIEAVSRELALEIARERIMKYIAMESECDKK